MTASSPLSSRHALARVSSSQPADATSAQTSAITINEVLYDADVPDVPDADVEWIEVHNAGGTAANLTGWTLRDSLAEDVLPPLVVPPYGYAIIAASAQFHDAHPGVAAPIVVLGGRIGNGLGNDGDSLQLFDADGVLVDALSWGEDISVLQPAIDDVPAGHSIERILAGVDSDTAADFIDNERPSPGAGYTSPAKSKPQPYVGGVRVIERAGTGAPDWLPWAIALASAVACTATLGWRTLEVVRRARLP
jgi:hypothetical protein